jgi:hypothetical protein
MERNSARDRATEDSDEFRGAAGISIVPLLATLVNRIVLNSDRISNDHLPLYRHHAMFLGYPPANIEQI